MKKTLITVLLVFILAGSAYSGLALYINGGVSDYDPTVGLNVEAQAGFVSVLGGIGSLAYNNVGWGAGIKGYLFGIDGGPYLGISYGTTGVRATTHTDAGDNIIIDSSQVFCGFSGLAGWRFFFADGWNITFGAGISRADNSYLPTFDITAGYMPFADDETAKNAEKYRKSYGTITPEPEIDNAKKDMPGPEESGAVEVKPPQNMEEEQSKAQALTATAAPVPVTASAAPVAVTQVVAPAVVTITPEVKGNTGAAK
jgi:hypothetical protein